MKSSFKRGNQDVAAALDLLVETLTEEKDRIFAVGTMIENQKAKLVLAKAVTKLGAAQVAAIPGLHIGPDPFVGKERAWKYPAAIAPVGNGFFVCTQSNTISKIRMLSLAANALGVKLVIKHIK